MKNKWQCDGRQVKLNIKPKETRDAAVLSAARQLAKLHAAGFQHGHAHPKNFVVGRKGNARLVDAKLLKKVTEEGRHYDIDQLKYAYDPLSLGVNPQHNSSGIRKNIR